MESITIRRFTFQENEIIKMKGLTKCFLTKQPFTKSSNVRAETDDHENGRVNDAEKISTMERSNERFNVIKVDSKPDGSPAKTFKMELGARQLIKLKKQFKTNVNSINAIRMKILFLLLNASLICLVQGGFWTFYLPNFLKPKGFDELSDMIINAEARINETKDAYEDAKYFWGLLQDFDHLDQATLYPEESACSDVFPMFRDRAIEYASVDYEHYIRPYELYLEGLKERRSEWYPSGLESKAALPREWEHSLLKLELEFKIEWMKKLTEGERFRRMRDELIEIWKNVRRSLDTSLPCIYLRYAYRQVAEDINHVALEANLKGMEASLESVESAFKRVDKFKDSDSKIAKDIEEEITKENRFKIKS